ncbi:MAG: FliH/SctL family protein [Phycisphaerae bacterium]
MLKKPLSRSEAAYSFADLDHQARNVLKRAHAESAEILRRAEARALAESERIRREAFDRGLVEGRRQGEAQARAEARDAMIADARRDGAALIEALREGAAQFETRKRELLAAAETGVIQLALETARRICKSLAQRDTTPAAENARRVVSMTRGESDLELRLNPAEAERLSAFAPEFVAEIAEMQHVRIIPDESISRGGCVLRGRTVEIDATIETQLEMLAAALVPEPVQTDTTPPPSILSNTAAGESEALP